MQQVKIMDYPFSLNHSFISDNLCNIVAVSVLEPGNVLSSVARACVVVTKASKLNILQKFQDRQAIF